MKNLSIKKWKLRNPIKKQAYAAIYTACRNSSFKKGVCLCGNKKVEAHHEDYKKPLKVIWLCKKHHVEYDLKRRKKLLTV